MLKSATYTWDSLMRQGRFEQAWALSDEVLRERADIPCWHLPRHQQYLWDGTALHNRRILVRCYHGLGDTLQFIRYVPLMKKVASWVAVWAQPVLLPLLETMPEIDQLMPLHDGSPEGTYDVDVEVMELPHIFRTTLENIPAMVPYIRVDAMPLHTSGLKVGLVWKAGDWDSRRSLPFSLLEPLKDIEGISFYILQAQAATAGWNGSFGTCLGDLDLHTYASLIKGLDLLITVDSMPAHLAGALGIPVWTLLPTEADWRWMEHRCDSPWYPTMQLYRQQTAGDWTSVLSVLRHKLDKLATS